MAIFPLSILIILKSHFTVFLVSQIGLFYQFSEDSHSYYVDETPCQNENITFWNLPNIIENQGFGRTQSMNASSRTSSYFMSGSGNSITFQNGPWTWTFGQNIKFTFKFILSPFNKQESYHFHKKIGIWRRHFSGCFSYLVNKTVCCSQMCSTYQKYFGWCQSWQLQLYF